MPTELDAQKNEITEHHIYKRLAQKCKHAKNKKILEQISQDELKHHNIIKEYTKTEVTPNKLKVWWYVLLANILGLSFSLKLMERGEELAQIIYKQHKNPIFKKLMKDEHNHEKAIIRLLEDERVEYAGAIVLGLNDALVELTGALAGFTLALQNTRIIALIGFITGFAASLSMAASGFLASREEGSDKNPMKSALYTGVAYIVVVILLILPYILFDNTWAALGTMLGITVLIIAAYTYYISIAKELTFTRRFIEMAGISLGVAVISFFVGIIMRNVFGVDI